MATFRYYHALVTALLFAVPCAAQSAAALAINAGSATDVTGTGSSALTVAPTFSRSSALATSTFGASATRFANEAWSAGLTAALSARATERAVTPVIDIAASAATTSYDFSYATVDLIPSLEAKAGAARLFAGARVGAAGTSATLPAGPAPAFGPLPTQQATSGTSARSLIGGVTVASLAQGGEVSTIGYRGETGVVAGQRQTDHAVTAAVAGSRVMVGATVGHRVLPTGTATHGSASLAIVATRTVTFQLAAGNYPSNPMLGTAAGRFVNAGLSMRLGRGVPALPAPAGVKAPARGMTRLAIRADDAKRVDVGGDFNKWQLISTTRAANGVWYVDLTLAPGEYRYAFRIDGKEWRVPEGVAAADDEFGGKTAWLTVSRTDARTSSK